MFILKLSPNCRWDAKKASAKTVIVFISTKVQQMTNMGFFKRDFRSLIKREFIVLMLIRITRKEYTIRK